MLLQEGKRFKRSFCGYNRSAVDAEFDKLLSQNDQMLGEKQSLQSQISSLTTEKETINRERTNLSTTVTTMTSQVMELESSLLHARSENDNLMRTIDAHKAENNALQVRFDQLRVRDRDFALREREFAELQSSVSSIMSVTKRATDRLFQKAVDNQERVTQIAGDAAREVAAIRADMSQVREQLNHTLDELQDRIDRVDASLTGAVHKLIAIKHDDGLQLGDNQPDIMSEVDRLLSMRAGEVDFAGGKGYTVPVLGPYSAKFVSDTAQRVSDGRIVPADERHEAVSKEQSPVEVHKANPSPFESTQDSIYEANKLLERGGATPQEYYFPQPAQPVQAEPQVQAQPIQIGFAPEPPAGAPVAGMSSAVMATGAVASGSVGAASSMETYAGQSFVFEPVEQAVPAAVPAEPAVQSPARPHSQSPRKVKVCARRARSVR